MINYFFYGVVCLGRILDKLTGKDRQYIEFKQQRSLAVTANESQPGTDDYIETTHRAGYLITDEMAMDVLRVNQCLSSLIPIMSPTNSVINLSQHEADLKRLRLENHICMLKLTMPPEIYEGNGLEILEGYRLFGHDRISGAQNGWIGHIATEQTKVHRFEEGKKK